MCWKNSHSVFSCYTTMSKLRIIFWKYVWSVWKSRPKKSKFILSLHKKPENCKRTNLTWNHNETVKDIEGKNEKLPREMRNRSEIPGNEGKKAKKKLVIFILEWFEGCLEQYTEYRKCQHKEKYFCFIFLLITFFLILKCN